MEVNLLQRRKSLESKIPEIQKSYEMVEFLASHKESELETQFELAETLWASAKVKPTERVNLWLGANVMLEYTIPEASDLLSSKLKAAKTSLRQAIEDLNFLKEQITTMEVNIARIYNYDVTLRRKEKAVA